MSVASAGLAERLNGVREDNAEAGVIPKINPVERKLVGVANFYRLVNGGPHLPPLVLIVRGGRDAGQPRECKLVEA